VLQPRFQQTEMEKSNSKSDLKNQTF